MAEQPSQPSQQNEQPIKKKDEGPKKTLYEILNVAPTASAAEIKVCEIELLMIFEKLN